MVKVWCGLLGCVLALTLVAGPVTTAGPPAKDGLTAKVDKLFAKWDKPDAPGCALAIVKDGEVVYKRGYGMASLEQAAPIGTGTLFLIASVSKRFTVFLIMLLAQGGRLSLDDDVRKHIPELPNLGKTITIRHLIHHTSGLREELDVQALLGRGMEDVMTERDFLSWVRDQKALNFEPGSQHLYCNTGYSLLGLIVQRASGKSVRAYAEEKVFGPLGMKNTIFRDDHRMVIKNAATSYAPRPGGGLQRINVAYAMAGATNLFTTVEDLARWDQNFYDGRVGGKALIEDMLRKGRLNNGKEIAYAGGLSHEDYRGLKTVRHDGSHGGFRSTILRFPEQRFSVIILANVADSQPSLLAKKIADLYLADKFKPTPVRLDGIKVAAKILDGYAGSYKMAPGLIMDFRREGEQLVASVPGTKWLLEAASETEFFAKAAPLRCRFVKSAEGQVEKVVGALGSQDLAGRPIRPAKLTPEQLKSYVGDYYSDELRVIYTVSVRDGKLLVRHPRGETPVQAWEGEEFSGGLGTPFREMQFTRGVGKQVNGFLVSTGRLRNLRFAKVEIRPNP